MCDESSTTQKRSSERTPEWEESFVDESRARSQRPRNSAAAVVSLLRSSATRTIRWPRFSGHVASCAIALRCREKLSMAPVDEWTQSALKLRDVESTAAAWLQLLATPDSTYARALALAVGKTARPERAPATQPHRRWCVERQDSRHTLSLSSYAERAEFRPVPLLLSTTSRRTGSGRGSRRS
jgi:hypothetical protein